MQGWDTIIIMSSVSVHQFTFLILRLVPVSAHRGPGSVAAHGSEKLARSRAKKLAHESVQWVLCIRNFETLCVETPGLPRYAVQYVLLPCFLARASEGSACVGAPKQL